MDALERRDEVPRPSRAADGQPGARGDGPAGEDHVPLCDGDATPGRLDDDRWAPIDEVVRTAGITEAMAYRLITRGVLEACRPPRRGGDPGRGRAHPGRRRATRARPARAPGQGPHPDGAGDTPPERRA